VQAIAVLRTALMMSLVRCPYAYLIQVIQQIGGIVVNAIDAGPFELILRLPPTTSGRPRNCG